MRKGLIATVLCTVLLASLTGCGGTKPVPDTLNVAQTKQESDKALEYSKKLGDAALSAYIGREYDTEYSSVLSNIKPITEDSKRVYLENSASLTVSRWLSQATLNAVILPGYYKTQNKAQQGFSLDVAFQTDIFPDGKAPNIQPMDEFGTPTPAFKSWFLNRAVKAGLLDSRLRVEDGIEGKVYVDSSASSKEGLTFKVFDKDYTLDKGSLTSAYTMVIKSFIYYDTGNYTATYVTDTNAGASSTVTATVSFVYSSAKDASNAKSDLDKYLARVTNISVNITK